ncbi:Ldh family oxidoreductase [Paenibacillus filicis]|uniref:Ldh family oxidoreductase n=1 Tax=Paenibacillus filicis TaxID=669464 RepID=A0ABU9DTP7_9BACL
MSDSQWGTIQIDELKNLATRILLAKGATEREARIVVDDYLDADLRGRTSHGFLSFGVALSSFDARGAYRAAPSKGPVLHIEGHGDVGHIVARDAIDLALSDPDRPKVQAIGISGISRFNCPGVIARYGAQQGLVTLVWEYGGKNLMIPHGGTEAALSTNPLGIGIPHTDPLFVVDIALSERAIGLVEVAKLSGQSIPESWGVDEKGQATTDPYRVAAVKPYGGYKGYALALAFEILTGPLVGTGAGSKGSLNDRGALILLIDPTAFGQTAEAFREQVTDLLREIGESPPADPAQPVAYPGQASDRRAAEVLSSGQLSLPISAIDNLRSWAETLAPLAQ